MARSLCQEMQGHVLRSLPLVGDDIAQIPGPGGTWRLRMSESRGSMATCITAPSKERFWSSITLQQSFSHRFAKASDKTCGA